jgi:hypothetical protein
LIADLLRLPHRLEERNFFRFVASSSTVLPNFFIVGAPKAGTTSLYHYLDQHPEIYMSPIKEPNYFSSEVRPENFSEELRPRIDDEMQAVNEYLRGPMREKRFGGIVSEWHDYIRLFRNVDGQKAIGEASVCYLWSGTAAANIYSRVPHAKIIMILRDPAERVFSQYLHVLGMGLVRDSFRQEVDASLRHESEQFRVLSPFLEFGLYYGQVKRYLEWFPKERVCIHLFEDYQKEPARVLRDIFDFLGVDSRTVPDTSRKHLEARIPRSVAISYFLRKKGIWRRAKELLPYAVQPALRKLAYGSRNSAVMILKTEDTWLDTIAKISNG